MNGKLWEEKGWTNETMDEWLKDDVEEEHPDNI